MTKNSYICNYINKYPNHWRDEFEALGITVTEEDTYAIFNYNILCDFNNPLVQEARGIIIDLEQNEVVSWPFRKFGNYAESYADEIDWNSARVQEKIDGSIIKLWYDSKINNWRFSTNGMITPLPLFKRLIDAAIKYTNLDFTILNKDYTYIFELISPDNQIVIKYDTATFYHIGTRNNKTGQEITENIGIQKPKEYKLSSLHDCITAVQKLNINENKITHEGFVVVDKNYNRIKIKSPEYLMCHRAFSKILSKKDFISIIHNENINTENALITQYPSLKKAFAFYKWQYEEFLYEVEKMIKYARSLYEEYSYDRSAVAKTIKYLPYSNYGFAAIGNDLSINDLIKNDRISRICKYIKDYEGKIPRNFVPYEKVKIKEQEEIEYE